MNDDAVEVTPQLLIEGARAGSVGAVAPNAQTVPATPRGHPLRFGVADLWLLSMLVALHFAGLFRLFSLRLDEVRIERSAAAVAALSIALVGGGAYLAYRKVTEKSVDRVAIRLATVVGYEMLIMILVAATPLMLYLTLIILCVSALLGPFIAVAVTTYSLVNLIMQLCKTGKP